MNWTQQWFQKTTSKMLVNIAFLEDCVNQEIPVDLVCKAENWITASSVLAALTKRQCLFSSDQTLVEHLSSKEVPLIHWHLLQLKGVDCAFQLQTQRVGVIAVQAQQLRVPGSTIRWGGSVCLMCGELFRSKQAFGVDWLSEEKKIYQELSKISEPY
jgi:hypothetical protein